MERRYTRGTMTLLAHTFGINHATVTTPILYQTTYLGHVLGNTNNAILYMTTMMTALFLGGVLNDKLGARLGLSLSMFGYTVYVTLFAFSLLFVGTAGDPNGLVWVLGTLGAFLGGVAAGPLWTFQGVVVGRIIEDVARAEGQSEEVVSSQIWGTFGLWFLGWEAVMRAMTTVLLKIPGFSPKIVFFIFALLAGLSTFLWHALSPAGCDPPPSGAHPCTKAGKAILMWRKPKTWLLQFTNLTFGFAAAWNASYVGPHFTSKALSPDVIGFTGALISLIGGIGSRILGRVSETTGKGVIILLGSIVFFAIGALSKIIDESHAKDMGLQVLVFPVCMGIGRAVYESTNKGVFIDFYPKPQKRAAVFANVMVFGTMSSSMVFILDIAKAFDVVIYLLMVFACCTFPGIAIAGAMKRRKDAEKVTSEVALVEG